MVYIYIYIYIYITLSHLRSKKTESIYISHVAQLPLSENALMRNGGGI